jgi:hypothetical protein
MRNKQERASSEPFIDTGARNYRRLTGAAVLAAGALFAAWALNQGSGESAPEEAPVAGPATAGE